MRITDSILQLTTPTNMRIGYNCGILIDLMYYKKDAIYISLNLSFNSYYVLIYIHITF